ncbi:MAG: hypothetical protein WCP21_02565 [Armatimonadota bacterium]
MKYLAIIVVAGLAVFTAVSIALGGAWLWTAVNVGSYSFSVFDLLFFAAAGMLLVRNAVRLGPERIPANRLVLWLCWAYVGYQALVVLPAAVVLHSLRPIDAFRLLQPRLSLILVPFTYAVVLRYWKPAVLIAIVDAAAAGLAVWALYRYVTHGAAQGYVESGVFRFRIVWTGGVMLCGWLLLTSLFYWPLRVWRLALAALALVGLSLANYRSGVVALAAGFLAVLVTMQGVSRRALVAMVLIFVVSFGVYVGASSNVRRSVAYSLTTAFNPSSDQTAHDRLTRSALGLDYFMLHPLGDYVWSKTYYTTNLGWNFVPHNFVVQLLVTQGVVASALYFAIMGSIISIGWRNRRDRLSSVMLVYLFFYLTFCLFNPNIDIIANVSLFSFGVALVLHQNRELTLRGESVSPADEALVESGAGLPGLDLAAGGRSV